MMSFYFVLRSAAEYVVGVEAFPTSNREDSVPNKKR